VRILRAELSEDVDLEVVIGDGRIGRLGPDEVGGLAPEVAVELGVDELDTLAGLNGRWVGCILTALIRGTVYTPWCFRYLTV
jgi:hypothetical protein